MSKGDEQIAVNENGVRTLRNLASTLPEIVSDINNAVDKVEETFESNKGGLGPHSDSIKRALESIREETHHASSPVLTLAERIDGLADTYQDIIDYNRY